MGLIRPFLGDFFLSSGYVWNSGDVLNACARRSREPELTAHLEESPLNRFSAVTPILALTAVAGTAAANHIDFIEDGQFIAATTSDFGVVFNSQAGNTGNILGSQRDIILSVGASGDRGLASAGTVGADQNEAGTPGGDEGSIFFDTSTGSFGMLELLYDGIGEEGLGGLDFISTWNFIAVDFAAVQGAADVEVRLNDTSGRNFTATESLSDAGTLFFALQQYVDAGVDLTDVNVVSVKILSTQAASDFEISSITREVVPEPASLAIAGLGLGLLAARRRRA